MMCCTTLAAICTAVAASKAFFCYAKPLCCNVLRELAIRSNKIVRCGIWTISGVVQRFLRTHRHECGNAAVVSSSSHNLSRTPKVTVSLAPVTRMPAGVRRRAGLGHDLGDPGREVGGGRATPRVNENADYKNTHAYVRDSTVDATSGARQAGSP